MGGERGSPLVFMPGCTSLKNQLCKMISAVCKMICNKISQKQKTQKLMQNQSLKRELFEYEPVRG